jgi:lysophospholipase L1-like esterase
VRLFTKFTLAILLATGVPLLAQDHWVASWGAAAVECSGETVPDSGVTYRNIAYMSLGGKQVRLTLSNHFGTGPLNVGGVTIAKSHGDDAIDDSSLRVVNFSGKPTVTIAPGATILSDPVSIDVSPLSNLDVSIFIPAGAVSMYTCHPVSHQTNYRAVGNFLRTPNMPEGSKAMPWRVLTAIDVMAPATDAAIVAFGDSITDGQGSTNNANLRWPNRLAARLQADPKYARFAVVDEGIGGNRILHEGGTPDARAGRHVSAVDRWSLDALDRSGVKYIILLEGVNDIGHSSLINAGLAQARQERNPEKAVTADDLIKAMTQLIDQAHAKGIKVIGATLTPFGGANYERPDGEESHIKLNDFIRHGGKFDGVIDFEKATQDPEHPDRYLPAYNDKDHLHPNDAGTKAMGDSIDLSLFK